MYPDLDLSAMLAFAPRNVPLRVLRIGTELRDFCDDHGVHEGDRVTRRGIALEEVELTKADGRRLRLSVEQAVLMAVQPALVS